MSYQEVLDFLYSQLPMYQRVGTIALNHDLGKTIMLHKHLGDPQKSFKSIHVGGTNGKGSTAHFMASILQEAGYKVGLYTSPHLKSFRERIRINGEMVSEDFIIDFVELNSAIIKEIQPSFFEMTVGMAYQYFAMQKVDFAVVEVGLGGRLDSTNIITPEVSIITSIGYDHQDILGNSIAEIASEKAGIIKPSVPVVVGEVNDEAKKVIRDVARANNAPCYFGHDDYHVENEGNVLSIHRHNLSAKEYLDCDLKGDSPILNLPVVLQSIDLLKSGGVKISPAQLKSGIEKVTANTKLLGRWQVIAKAPLTICDIGHNEEAVQFLVSRLLQLQKRLKIVWGMNKDKKVDNILALLPRTAMYYFCTAKIERALQQDQLKEKAMKYDLQGASFNSVNDAVHAAMKEAESEDVIFIGGSTFVVAELESLL